MSSLTEEFKLNDAPTDGISSVKFGAAPNLLISSSWDNSVRIYDVAENSLLASYQHKAAVLDACLTDNSTIAYSGGIDAALKRFDISANQELVLGYHEKAIKSVCYSESRQIVFTGSWDKSVKVWDPRASEACVLAVEAPERVLAMDINTDGSKLVVGTHGRLVYILDIRMPGDQRNLVQLSQRRESGLKHQTRCIKCNPENTGYALSSIEGRVAIEYFDASPEWQDKKYAFKCHKISQNGVDTLYPVNAMAFHPKYGTFATGGCDGFVAVWDPKNRKRIFHMRKFPTSIASLAFNSEGKYLAVASSYTYESGEKEPTPDEIYIKVLQDADVKPKPKASSSK